MAYFNMTNGVSTIAVDESFKDYWSEKGYSLVEPPKKQARTKRTVKKAGDDNES